MLTMSLFCFVFKPVGDRTETDKNISNSAVSGDDGMSDVSTPTGLDSAAITGNETEESCSSISGTAS